MRRVGQITATFGVVAGLAAGAAAAPTALAYVQGADTFAAIKGERALVMGYADGLEIWAYPLQLVRDYRIGFRVAGQVATIAAAPLLQRVERNATETVRVYVGPDFVVRERVFVPSSLPGAIIRYEVDGRPDVRIEVAFAPSLDLMWPGALGGQSLGWDAARSGFVEREPLHGFNATIASAEIVERDATVNRTRPTDTLTRFVLAPVGPAGGPLGATVYIGSDDRDTPADRSVVAAMKSGEARLQQDAADRAAKVLADSLTLTTPDEAVNKAFASAVLALDQAWVCNPALGCGVVAGYGPSRPGRRPQYDWFFAGDGLVAMQAMLDAGQYGRARDELDFIIRYQDRTTGMVWHELSQSAALIEWATKYPYMFVHVDISFQFLAGLDRYVRTTGDVAFARAHWASIAAAYHYCTSVIDAATGLPHIPPGKQGQNEQDVMRDDIRLSTAWIDAADGFARLARATGHGGPAADADSHAALARAAVARDGWDGERDFWLSGHTLAGAPIHSERPDAIGVLDQAVFPRARANVILDRIASPEFVTDWGVRSLSAAAPDYDPNRYGSGSVWALGTAGVAGTLWRQHRPEAAWGIWHGLVAWDTLDSAGHLHEVLAGDLFHPEFESVPEQTWSSAGLVSSAVGGLLGLEVRGQAVRLAPHLPPQWPRVAVTNVRAGAATLDFAINRDTRGLTLTVVNYGEAAPVEFAPMVPLGATVGGATVDGTAIGATAERHAHDQHAAIHFTARHGTTRTRIDYTGGVDVAVVDPPPAPGDASRNPRIVGATVAGDTLVLDAWIGAAGASAIDLYTPWSPRTADGARLERSATVSRLVFDPPASGVTRGFTRRRVTVTFDRSAPGMVAPSDTTKAVAADTLHGAR